MELIGDGFVGRYGHLLEWLLPRRAGGSSAGLGANSAGERLSSGSGGAHLSGAAVAATCCSWPFTGRDTSERVDCLSSAEVWSETGPARPRAPLGHLLPPELRPPICSGRTGGAATCCLLPLASAPSSRLARGQSIDQ